MARHGAETDSHESEGCVAVDARHVCCSMRGRSTAAVVSGETQVVEVYRMTQEQPAHGVAFGTQAPDFSLTTSDGGRVSLGDFRGHQPVLLVFYRGWW